MDDIEKNVEEPNKNVKKPNTKLRVLIIILLIILAILIIVIGRKMIILSSLSNKAEKYANSDNFDSYYEEIIAYDKSGTSIYKNYYKNNKLVSIISYVSEDGKGKTMTYCDGETIKIYKEYNGKKTTYSEPVNSIEEVNGINAAGNYFYDTNNLWDIFLLSTRVNIKSTIRNGKSCYLITESYYTDSIFDDWLSFGTYIDKETGLTIRSENGTLIDEDGTETDMIMDFRYEFNNVTDDIFVEPDMGDYEIGYYDEYLETFLPTKSANNFLRNIDKFTNEDISTYLHFYYMNYANRYDLAETDENSNYTYTVSKEEIDEVVYEYFGIKDYEIIDSTGRTGIRKIDDNTYQIYWFGTSWMAPTAVNAGVSYDGDNAIVKYKLVDVYDIGLKEGDLIFYLTYNEGNYNVSKIEYIEEK